MSDYMQNILEMGMGMPPTAPNVAAPTSPEDPFGMMEQYVQERLKLDPEARAKKKMEEYLKKTWGIDPAKGKQRTRRVLAGLGEVLMGAPQARRRQMEDQALEEYKAEAPILRTQMDVLAANKRAADALALRGKTESEKAAIANRLNEIKTMQAEASQLMASGKYQEAMAKIQEIGARTDLLGEQGAKVRQETRNLAETGGLSGAFGAANVQSRRAAKDPLAAKAWDEAYRKIREADKLAKFPPMGGQGSMAQTTSPVYQTDPATGRLVESQRVSTTIRRPMGAMGAPAPGAAPAQPAGQEIKIESPVSGSKAEAPVRVMPTGSRLLTTVGSAGEADKIKARTSMVGNVTGMAKALGNWYAEGKLQDWSGFVRNFLDPLGFKVRQRFGRVTPEEQAFNDFMVMDSAQLVKSLTGTQMTDRERQWLLSLWPQRTSSAHNLMLAGFALQLMQAGDAWRQELGLTPTESNRLDLVDKIRTHTEFLMRKSQEGDRLRRMKDPTWKDYKITQDDLDPAKVFMEDLRNAFPEGITRPDGSGLRLPPKKGQPSAPKPSGRVLRGKEALDLLR